MPDLIPAEDGIFDRHPESWNLEARLDSPLTISYELWAISYELSALIMGGD